MDTALKAMKRSAKAVLRVELAALRKQAKQDFTLQMETADALRAMREECDRYRADSHRRAQLLIDYQLRTEKVLEWAAQHRKGDFTVRACAEYIQQGANAKTYGAGLAMCNPFDRWQVLPAIK